MEKETKKQEVAQPDKESADDASRNELSEENISPNVRTDSVKFQIFIVAV